jgi:hypothetical protein
MPTTTPPIVQVLPYRAEVMFRDGSTIGLHLVASRHGAPRIFLRAVRGSAAWRLFDLRQLVPAHAGELECQLSELPPREQAATVFSALRMAFASATACELAIEQIAGFVGFQDAAPSQQEAA